MKYILTLALAAITLSVVAADNLTPPSKEVAAAILKEQGGVFKANELSIGSAYTARTEDLDKWKESITVGGDYWITQGAGLHAGMAFNDLNGVGVDLIEFGPTARLSFDRIRTAILFGIGAEYRTGRCSSGPTFNSSNGKETPPSLSSCLEDDWSVYAQVGAAWRLNDHLEPFALIRGIRPVGENGPKAAGEHIAILVGLNIPFQAPWKPLKL